MKFSDLLIGAGLFAFLIATYFVNIKAWVVNVVSVITIIWVLKILLTKKPIENNEIQDLINTKQEYGQWKQKN